MQPVVTAKEMSGLDRYCIDQLQIPGIVLMENAGIQLVHEIAELLGDVRGKYIQVYCGPGNNGGDGYVVARHLLNRGARVEVYIFAAREKLKGDALVNLQILEKMQAPLFWQQIPTLNSRPDLIIDALLGTGVKGALQGEFAACVAHFNNQNCPRVAVDIPTGVNADNGAVVGPAIRATVTVTMALPKRGLLFSPGRDYCGKVKVVDISMPAGAIQSLNPQVWRIEKTDIPGMLPMRSADAHKNKCGAVAVIAGSAGYTGAACLASLAVLRTGAGLCYLAVPHSLNSIIESKLTEVISWPVEDENSGVLLAEHCGELAKKIQQQDVVVIGPGLGQHERTAKLVFSLLQNLEKPLVLDADGLNICAAQTDLIRNYRGELVITPHPGEFSRLTGLSVAEILENRISLVQKYAREWNLTIILKGGPTIIGCKDGRIYINSSGNAGMATAGSGDVLSGMIAGLLAQGLPAETAAIAGVFLHGAAGDIVKNKYGEMGLMAGDILNAIPEALVSCTRL